MLLEQNIVVDGEVLDPLHIYREGKAGGLNLAGYKKYLNQVWLMYNGSSRKNALPQKY